MAQTRPSPTLSLGFTRLGRFLAPYGLDGLKRVGLPASAHQRRPYALSPADDRLCHPTQGGWTDETGHHPMP